MPSITAMYTPIPIHRTVCVFASNSIIAFHSCCLAGLPCEYPLYGSFRLCTDDSSVCGDLLNSFYGNLSPEKGIAFLRL